VDKRNYSSEGIILSRKNFGEADRLLTIFTKYHGKTRLVAKGIRRTSSRKRGSLELFAYVKFFAANGRNMDVLTEVEEKNNFSHWRTDLTLVAVAYHLAEVVERLTAEREEHKKVFELLLDAYENLEKLDYWAIYPYVQSFKVRILEELGFLERNMPEPKNLDVYIEDLINGKLKTRKFMAQISAK
jgi:DNA repair protein RecO (recombination protein O)